MFRVSWAAASRSSSDTTFCAQHILAAYYNQLERLKQLERVAPELAEQACAVIVAQQKENLALLDRMWKDSGVQASEQEWESASAAEDDAFMAVCAYRCHSQEELKAKAKYLLTTSQVLDNWDDAAKALLESLAGEQLS